MGTVTTHRVDLSGGRGMQVELRQPAGEAPAGGFPAVVVLHEIFGLTPGIRSAADRFADAGWASVTPEFFSAGAKPACLVRALREVTSHRPGRLTEDLTTVARWLGAQPGIDAERMGAVGFCLGGGFALLLGAVDGSGLKAVAANYGEVPDVSVLAKLPPVVGSYGAKDKRFGPQAVRLDEGLAACGTARDVKVYPDAGHAFMTRDHHPIAQFILRGAGFREAEAEDAWIRMLDFLALQVKS